MYSSEVKEGKNSLKLNVEVHVLILFGETILWGLDSASAPHLTSANFRLYRTEDVCYETEYSSVHLIQIGVQ